ncbi:hypothetical protein [Nostoc sp.]
MLKGTFVLPLPDDFDQPLEVFKEPFFAILEK